MAALVLLLALPGCGVGPLRPPAPSPSPLPPDRLVFSLEGFGGLVPSLNLALATPGVALYGDGRLVTLAGSGYAPDVPAAYEVARTGPDAVAAFVAEAEAADLIDEETDFGDPAVTDMPVTSVLLHGATGPHRASVYAFGERFDDGLSRRQRRARADLRDLVDQALALPGDSVREPYRPSQVRVIELDSGSGGKAAGADWPGPDPKTFLAPADSPGSRLACGTLSGTDATRAYAAARANPGGIWMVDGRPRVFAVAALLPGAEGCRR